MQTDSARYRILTWLVSPPYRVCRVYPDRYWSEDIFREVDTLVSISQEEGMTPAQVLLAWVVHQDVITRPIVGASSPERLRENVKALGNKLSGEAIRRLEETFRLI